MASMAKIVSFSRLVSSTDSPARTCPSSHRQFKSRRSINRLRLNLLSVAMHSQSPQALDIGMGVTVLVPIVRVAPFVSRKQQADTALGNNAGCGTAFRVSSDTNKQVGCSAADVRHSPFHFN